MSLQKSHGNMYDWVTHMHSHLGGECPNKCSYCYVSKANKKYCGPVRLLENELNVDYGVGKIIFIEHMNDLFHPDVDPEAVHEILKHCNRFPWNTYVFQTKNPDGYSEFYGDLPPTCILGTTIETNREMTSISKAPHPLKRFEDISIIDKTRFITIEPILDFDYEEFTQDIGRAHPDFVNIGADSKKHNLAEPSKEKVLKLIDFLNRNEIKILKKTNLKRIIGV